MRRTRAWTAVLAGSATALALGLIPLTQANAAPGTGATTSPAAGGNDTRELDAQTRAKDFKINRQVSKQAIRSAKSDPGQPPEKGDTRTWLGYDEYNGSVYLKRYVLRGVGPHVQVWLANDRAFPTDDCRNNLGLTDVTQSQVNNFVDEFNTNMYPKESKAFSVPPARNGKGSQALAEALDLPKTYWKVGANQADDIVARGRSAGGLRRQRHARHPARRAPTPTRRSSSSASWRGSSSTEKLNLGQQKNSPLRDVSDGFFARHKHPLHPPVPGPGQQPARRRAAAHERVVGVPARDRDGVPARLADAGHAGGGAGATAARASRSSGTARARVRRSRRRARWARRRS